MSTIHFNFSAQDVSNLYVTIYCAYATGALLLYEWLLCLGQEIKFIWSPDSKVTGSLLVYALSRYALLTDSLLVIASSYPMSTLSCNVNMWAQAIIGIVGTVPFGAFSALRAYALSNRNMWLAAVIILLAIAPPIVLILECFYRASVNLPSPFNCTLANSISPTLSISLSAVFRGSQFAAELLVVGITWYYTYHSYRIQQRINLGNTISSVLLYNGSLYFLFLAILYVLDVIFRTASVPVDVTQAVNLMTIFYDPITSILVCRFMLSLRQFERTIAPTTISVPGSPSQLREHTDTTSTVLEFAAQPSDSFPSFIASFAHPVHVDPALTDHCGPDSDAIIDDGSERRQMDLVDRYPTRIPSSCERTRSLFSIGLSGGLEDFV